MSYVVDTNIITWLIEGKIKFDDLPMDGEYLATYVQVEELNRTKDEERRRRLLLAFATLRPRITHTETADWGVAPLGYFKLGEGPNYARLKDALDKKNNSKSNNKFDALIAEVALVNEYTLITADSQLAEVMRELGGKVRQIAL